MPYIPHLYTQSCDLWDGTSESQQRAIWGLYTRSYQITKGKSPQIENSTLSPYCVAPFPANSPSVFSWHQNAVDSISTEWYSVPWHPGPSISGWQRWSNCIQLSHLELPFGYWTVRHGKLHYLKGKSPTNMYNGVIVRGYGYVKLPDGIYPTLSDFVKTPNSNLTSSTYIYIYIYIYICQKNHCWISE